MPTIPPKYRPYTPLFVGAVVVLLQVAAHLDLRNLGRLRVWLDLGLRLLIAAAGGLALAGCIFGYYRFCLWFHRSIEAKRARIAERIRLRDGEVTWPASDPLHDPELDGSTGPRRTPTA